MWPLFHPENVTQMFYPLVCSAFCDKKTENCPTIIGCSCELRKKTDNIRFWGKCLWVGIEGMSHANHFILKTKRLFSTTLSTL